MNPQKMENPMNQPVDLPLPVGHYATLPNGLRLHYLDEGAGPVVLWPVSYTHLTLPTN